MRITHRKHVSIRYWARPVSIRPVQGEQRSARTVLDVLKPVETNALLIRRPIKIHTNSKITRYGRHVSIPYRITQTKTPKICLTRKQSYRITQSPISRPMFSTNERAVFWSLQNYNKPQIRRILFLLHPIPAATDTSSDPRCH